MIDLYQKPASKFENIKNWFIKKFQFLKNSNSIFYYVLLLTGVAFGFYFLLLINNLFTTPWSGDFVMQYIPLAFNYYDDWWGFIKTGVFPHWDSNIFLGADTVTSDGYYIMFSPFFIPLLFFPRSWIPQIMALISIFRMVLAGVFFRMYLKKIGISERFARLGGIAYAFCGYVAFFNWFNNFLDIAVLLALVLYGIEVVLKDKRPWVLAISLGFVGIDNFFFFPAIVILTFIYSIFRFIQRIELNNWKNNLFILGMGFCGYVLAIMIGGCVLLPGLITGMSDPKIEGASYLSELMVALKTLNFDLACKLLFSWDDVPGGGWRFQYFPIIELFIPPVTCRHIALINYASGNTFDNNAGSLWVTMPIIFFFFPAVVSSLKNRKISVLFGVGITCLLLFTPFAYFLLFGGGKAYSRWQIIVPAVMIAFVINYLDKNQQIKVYELCLGLGFMIVGLFMSGVLAHAYVNFSYNQEYFLPFPLVLFIELAYIIVLFIIFTLHYQKALIKKAFIYITCFESVLVGTFVAVGHGFTSPLVGNGGLDKNYKLHDVVEKIDNQDDDFYRMYTSLNIKSFSDNNQNMNNYNGVSMFNTLYNYNTRLFKWWSRLSDSYSGWSAGYFEKRIALDQFLGIKYYVIDKSSTKQDIVEGIQSNVPFGYEYNDELSSDYFEVYKKEYNNTIGYGYDDVFTYSKNENPQSIFDGSSDYRFNILRNEQMYLEDAIIDEEVYETFDEEIKQELNLVDLTYSLKDTAYQKLEIKDDASLNQNNSAPYVKHYYEVENSKEYDINDLGKIPSIYTPLSRNRIDEIKREQSGNVFIFISKKDGTAFDNFEQGISLYIDAGYTQNYKSDIYLIGENGKIITFDNHSDDKGFSTSARWVRGFYSTEPVYAIAIYPRFYGWGNYNVYSESKASWDNRLSILMQNSLKNVKYVDFNTYTFDTDYDKTKVVVTNIAYEKGWKLYAKNSDGKYENIPTFLGQGGFVSFLAKQGQTSYIMKYINPDFAFALKFTDTALVILVGSYAIYVFIDDYNRKKMFLKQFNGRF